ncbi:MAG: class I SAM-dependent RNA methyltransferase, partial [Planctomycetota bacterium]|nr:class I SAM-dependent RNA methyltransferase [Planctomycetota bacterium]
ANAQTAGVLERIDLRLEEFDATPLCQDAVIFVNPPWGLRLGEEEALVPLYRALGDWMKQGATGGRGYVLTGSPRLAKEVGLRPSRRMPFVVGDIECRLLEFPLH